MEPDFHMPSECFTYEKNMNMNKVFSVSIQAYDMYKSCPRRHVKSTQGYSLDLHNPISTKPNLTLPKRIPLPIVIIPRRRPKNIRSHIVPIRTSRMCDSSHTSYHRVEESGYNAVHGSGGGGDVVCADIVAFTLRRRVSITSFREDCPGVGREGGRCGLYLRYGPFGQRRSRPGRRGPL